MESSLTEHGPMVAIVIINFNGFNDTVECLKSLERLNYSNKKIYLIDNHSPDRSGFKLKTDLQKSGFENKIELILSERNLGFSGGNNLGIRQALAEGAEYIWLLNNDTIVAPGTLNSMVQSIHNDPKAGICGSKIYFSESDRIWYAGGVINRWGFCSHTGLNEEDPDGSLYDRLQEVDFTTGCSLLVKRETIAQTGLLDEQFFLYFEDVEFCMRARKMGWKNIYDPNSILWHKASSSTGSTFRDYSPVVDYYDTRNQILFVKKCYKNRHALFPLIGIFLSVIKKHIRLVVRPETRKTSKLAHIYLGIQHGIRGKYGVLTRS